MGCYSRHSEFLVLSCFSKVALYMSDRKTHKYIGAGTGAVYAAFQAKDQSDTNFWIEAVGGALGGYSGGIVPDVLEPAICSWHRGVCHSWTAAGTVLYARATLAQWAESCRKQADKCRLIPMVEDLASGEWVPIPQTPIQNLVMQLGELFWRLLAGFLNGFAAGYISHLALDSGTPRGLPVLMGKMR
jgi:hypothetical protein